MGAQNARTLVKNQCRTKTTMSVFFVSVHVCEKIAIARMYALVGVESRMTRVQSSNRSAEAGSMYKVCSRRAISAQKQQSHFGEKDDNCCLAQVTRERACRGN